MTRSWRGEKLLTDDIAEDALNAMRFLPGESLPRSKTSLRPVYDGRMPTRTRDLPVPWKNEPQG